MIKWIFLNQEEALSKLSQKDEYIQRLNKENLELHKVSSVEEYLENLPLHVGNWSEEQMNQTSPVLQEASRKLNEAGFTFDMEIGLILTNGKEMFNLEYTRDNCIVFPYLGKESFKKSKSDLYGFSETLIVHELFHIITRKNPSIRNSIYKSINFRDTGFDFLSTAYPKQIINPDALEHRWLIDLELKDSKEIISAFPVIIQKKWQTLIQVENRIMVKTLEASETNFQDLIRKELTGYLSHPEEISAEYFKRWICYNDDEKFEEVRKFKQAFLASFNTQK